MKLNEIALREDEVIQIDEFLESKCAHYLDELGDDADQSVFEVAQASLYRGMESPGAAQKAEFEGEPVDLYLKKVRQNRAPRDTHPDVSELLDELFEKKFGWKPRSQGLFCYGRRAKHLAGQYGTAFAIMPMGKFKYLWNPEVRDLTVTIAKIFSQQNIKARIDHSEYSEAELDMMKPFLESIVNGYRENELKTAIRVSSEIMIGCAEFAAIKG